MIRFLLGDETAISRYFARSRERKGFDALSDGMVALASGDSRLRDEEGAARREAAEPSRPDAAADRAGGRARAATATKAFEAYKALLPNDRTRPVGVQGLMRLKLDEGDTDTAMALAKKAFALSPDNERVLRTLFDLQSKKEDWAGARETLNATMHARLLPRDVGTRRDAVLSLADARAALADGRHRARQRGGAAGEPAGADADPGRGARGAGAGGDRIEAQGDPDADQRPGR